MQITYFFFFTRIGVILYINIDIIYIHCILYFWKLSKYVTYFVGGNITQEKAQKGVNGLRLTIPSFTEALQSECHHIFMFDYEMKTSRNNAVPNWQFVIS